MKLTKIIIVTAVGVLGFLKSYGQQNLQFSQYVFNGLALNPAYAGYKEEWYLQMMYRSQWAGLDGAPRTGLLSADGLTNNPGKRVGLGLQLVSDRLGPQETLSGYAFYAYRLQLDDADTRRLSFGLGWGFTQYAIDGNALIANDANDPEKPEGKTSTMTPDLRFGVYYTTPKFYLSFSMMDMFSEYTGHRRYHWNGYNYEVMRKSRYMYLSAGMLFNLSENLRLKPSFLMKEDFKGPTNLDVNALLLINDMFWVGGSWRTGVNLWEKSHLPGNLQEADAVSAIAEFFVNDRFRIGYAFDYTLSELSNYENGSHEISIGYIFPNKESKEKDSSPRLF